MCVVGSGKIDGIIRCENVNKTFISGNGVYEVVRNLNLSIRENEFVVLFGPGQCGKTTVLNLIAGLEAASDGEVRVDGKKWWDQILPGEWYIRPPRCFRGLP